MKITWPGASKNIIGQRVRTLRTAQGLSQRQLAEKLQLMGLDSSDLMILRIESGKRFVADFELRALAGALDTSYQYLLDGKP